ncbi:hypothetical protein GCM10010116_29300 [Microbispora rosea subsp. aerata]|nr:hypothetical protein [Microbispora rosea]GGO14534.1 hypothetical protein GCM10010116_29300 [Microbispora rosea subsp. aerata]GIH55544.1 hypothetical protein Mro02_24580 [Microbispora rosea subsp. aerata]GLJ86488.1 hypothetical protein GCM10017588_52260 [Microbispora rosea subsp. aerata]
MTLFAAVDDEIRDARDRARRRDRLARQRATLLTQIEEVRGMLADLERQLAKEDHDVAKLEQGGFAAFLAGLTGNKEERLARERAEAAAARQRVTGQRTRLEWLTGDLRTTDQALAEIGDPRQELEVLLARKERMLVESGDPRGRELADIAAELANVSADLREHQEARQAGAAAGQAVGYVLRHLGDARGASTWDMFSSGGGFADMVEHGHLRQADEAAWHAQGALDRFSRELADIGVSAAPQLPKVDTRWFADVFFDNIITDAVKHRRIARTAEAVREVAAWVEAMVNQIAARCGELTRQRESLVRRREELLSS